MGPNHCMDYKGGMDYKGKERDYLVSTLSRSFSLSFSKSPFPRNYTNSHAGYLRNSLLLAKLNAYEIGKHHSLESDIS